VSGDGILLDGLRSISLPAFGEASEGKSCVGSTPLVNVWDLCVLLPLSWFLSKSILLVLTRRKVVDAIVYLLPRIARSKF